MRIVRKAAILLAAALLGAALSGCHGARSLDPFAIPDAFDESREYEITFWAKNDTNKTQTAIYERAIAEFETLYPNVTVNLRLYTDYGRIYNDVITNIATRTTPNVCITYPDHIATYLTGVNIVVPLDTLLADARYGLHGGALRYTPPGEVIPQFLGEGAIGGVQYALPFMRSTEACYINKTFVEALGYTVPDVLTWDFIWEVSDAAAAKDAEGTYLLNGQKVMLPFIYKSTDNMMIQALRQQDAGYSTPEGGIEIFNDTTKAFLYTVAEHAARGAFSTFKFSSYPANFLNLGQCVFAVDSTAGSTWMGTYAPLSDVHAPVTELNDDDLFHFETAVRPVPQFDPAHPQMISQGPSVCVFNKDDPQVVLASWLFAQYLLTDSVQIAYAETEGYVPVTVAAQGSAEYREYLARGGEDNDLHYDVKIAATRLLLDHIGDTFVTPVFNGSASLRDAAGQMIENVNKSVRRRETVDEAYMEKLYGDVTALYRLNSRGASASAGRAELGPLPSMSVGLLCTLGAVWMLLGAYAVRQMVKKHKKTAAAS